MATPLTLAELQRAIDDATGGGVQRTRSGVAGALPAASSPGVALPRAGRVFVVGDAAHIHSPVGAQGMNTGMQDAWNLGWKLALVLRGAAHATLLDTYEAERWPVGRALLRGTDRIFGLFTRAMSSNAAVAWLRRVVLPRIVPLAIGGERLRTFAFRFVSEIGIEYRDSTLATEGTPALSEGPRAGERLPGCAGARRRPRVDAAARGGGRVVHGAVWCASGRVRAERARSYDRGRGATAPELAAGATARVVGLAMRATTTTLVDESGVAFERLGVRESAVYLVRPDGYVAYRCAGTELGGVEHWLAELAGRDQGVRLLNGASP